MGAKGVHNIKQCGAVILVATCKPIDHDITQGTDDDTLHRSSRCQEIDISQCVHLCGGYILFGELLLDE